MCIFCSQAGLVLCQLTSCMYVALNIYIKSSLVYVYISQMPILNSGLVHPIISTFKQLAITNMQIDTQMPNQMVDGSCVQFGV